MGMSTRQEGQLTPTNIQDSSRSNNNKSFNQRCHRPNKGKGKVHWEWERDFCRMNGIAWRQILNAKKDLRVYYPKLVAWKDSAGREAFQNAKARYWAQINGFEVEAPLPDPELFKENNDASMSEIILHENLKGSISDNEYDEENDCSIWGDGGVILLDEHYCKWRSHDLMDDSPIIATGWVD